MVRNAIHAPRAHHVECRMAASGSSGHDCADEMGDPSEPAREGVFDSGPQLRSPSMQPPSSREGVWVHAFWFVLIFAAFLTYCQRSGQ